MNQIANFFTRLISRYMPDPLVIAILLTALTLVLAVLVEGASPAQALNYWGGGFWDLLSFSMQMTVILLAGYILAKTPLVDGLLGKIATSVSTPFAAIVVATLVGGIGSWLNWGFGLVVGSLVAQKLAMNVRGLHYPLVIASAYSGFALYGIGLSGTVPLLIATPGHFLEAQLGIVPLSETIFSPYVLGATIVVLVTLPFFNAMMHPRRAEQIIEIKPEDDHLSFESEPTQGPAKHVDTFADHVNRSPIIGIGIGLLGLIYVLMHFFSGGSLNLNILNFAFVFLGILLFASPQRYLAALNDGVRIVAGIIVQYPFYAGIMAILTGSGLVTSFAQSFVGISSAETLPIWSFISGGLVNLLAPSGGGQWAVQGPVMVEAAKSLGASQPATALAVQIGDQWTNMIQPFWLLPVLAISGLKLRDVMGYMVLVLFYLGLIFASAILLWGFTAT